MSAQPSEPVSQVAEQLYRSLKMMPCRCVWQKEWTRPEEGAPLERRVVMHCSRCLSLAAWERFSEPSGA